MTCDALEIRNLRFDFGGVPRYWHGNRRSVTLFMNNLSIFFPPGERFFIASVKAHAPQVTDEKLLREMRLFSGQEGVHSREHAAYNAMIEAQGYPARALEDRVDELLGVASRRLPACSRLAITCALEHFTAVLARQVLSNPRIMEGAHPTMAGLWRWHAAEESEHKAVAFDVYRAVGGSYVRRVFTMLMVTLTFWARVIAQQIRLMRIDGCLFSRREWALLYRFLFIDPGGMRGIGRPYLRYYRPSFHPNDDDTRALIERWKAQGASSLGEEASS
jgi:predicted metal-dependent hydrolase